MGDITTIILTYNEKLHIERCIKNALRFSNTVFLVDSYSTDGTVEIAESMGATVFQNKWENNHAKQFNWGLEHLPIQTEWVFRLDADEYLTDELITEIKDKTPHLDPSITGLVFERKMYFLDKLMEKGMIQMNILRMFRLGKAFCENRWMDEHIVLTQGKSAMFNGYFVDHNLNSLGWWIQKHNNYAIREAIDLLNLEFHFTTEQTKQHTLSADAEEKRKKKKRYANLPLFWRSFIYFLYRYFIKLGFTQGKEGFLWHFLQGFWYRTLVDAKVYEIKKKCGKDKSKVVKFIQSQYGIRL